MSWPRPARDARHPSDPGDVAAADAWIALGLPGPRAELPADPTALLPPCTGPSAGRDQARLRRLLPAVVEALRAGMPLRSALGVVGLDPGGSTWRWWRERAAEGVEPYCSALSVMGHARVLGEIELVRAVREAGVDGRRKRLVVRDAEGHVVSTKDIDVEPDWRAAAWLLERTMPERYGPQAREEERERVEPPRIVVEGPDGAELVRRLVEGPGAEAELELEGRAGGLEGLAAGGGEPGAEGEPEA